MKSDNKYSILIIDDDIAIRELCKKALEKNAEVIDWAESAEDGMKFIKRKNYDVILLDIYLPGMSGDKFMKEIVKECPSTKVIMITGYPKIEIAIETLRGGAFDYIIKPFKINDLRTTVKKAVTEQRLAESEVRRQHEFLKSIFESIPYPLYVIDINDYTVKMKNSAAGLGAGAICYQMHKRNEPCSGSEYPCPLEKVKKTKKPVTVEHIHYDKDGSAKVYEIHGYPVRDSKGNIIQMIEYTVDITERKKVEEALRKTNIFLKNILESSSSISIISTDLKENIIFWNKGAENILGYKAQEVVGRQKINIVYPEDEKETMMKVEEVREYVKKNKKPINCEIREITKEGRKIWVNLNTTPRLDEKGSIIGLLGIGEDITERRKTEEELREKVLQLEKFTDIAVGRELKMSEMDKEIKRLKKELKKNNGPVQNT